MDENVVEIENEETIENVENVCRLCLSTDGPRASVFGTQEKEKESSSVSLIAKIRACLSIQVRICATCILFQ